jgi:hypothetical protein
MWRDESLEVVLKSVPSFVVSNVLACVVVIGLVARAEASTIAWPQQSAPSADFFNGLGTNDSAYADTGKQFRLTWTLAGTAEGPALWDLTKPQDRSFSRLSSNSGDWFIDPSSYFRAGYSVMFEQGVSGGSEPKWSMFLLDPYANGDLSGVAKQIRFDPNSYTPTVVSTPEPAALVLFGSGLLVLAHRHRRARRARA